MEIIDAYTHCGKSKYEPFERVRSVMSSAGVSRAVLVQHMGEFDNSYIGSCIEAEPERFAGVLLVDHRDANVRENLERWTVTKHFQGIRLTLDSVSTNPELFVTAGDLGLVIVLYTPNGFHQRLADLKTQMESAPFTRLVITHLGNPRVDGTTLDDSAREIFELTRFANVYLQLSGMKMFCPYQHEPLYPLISEAVEKFGVDRIIWGSNYPVVGSPEDYQNDLRLLLDGHLPIPNDAIPKVVGENARRLWFAHA